MLCNCKEEATAVEDETDGKDDLRLRKLQLLASLLSPTCQVQHQRSRHRDEAVVGVKMLYRCGPSPYPGAANEASLVLLLSYAPGDHLVVRTTPS
jgi:hypothetical protein